MRCAHAHSYSLFCAQGLPQGFSLKMNSVSGGSFIRVKSVKEELSVHLRAIWEMNEVCYSLNIMLYFLHVARK